MDEASGEPRHARVRNGLGRAIVSGTYGQGALLPGDAELMERFGVSRTVLREALKALAGKGLIAARARVGTRVCDRAAWNLFDPEVLAWHADAGVTPAFLKHLGEMRLAFEPEAAALAAQRRTDQDLAALHTCLEQMAGADFVAADVAFHLAVARAADNPFMRTLGALIEVALASSLTVSSPQSDPQLLAQSLAAHRAILAAIDRRDEEAARTSMRAVIEAGMRRVRGEASA